MKRTLALLAVLACASSLASAHNVWFVPAADSTDGGQSWRLVFGHGGELHGYPPAKVIGIYAKAGERDLGALPTRRDGDVTVVTVPPHATLVTVEFDNGYWSRTPAGSVAGPRNEVPHATHTSHAVKLGKLIVDWDARVSDAVGQDIEIVPLAAQAPTPGSTLDVRVLWRGEPLPGAKVSTGDGTNAVTDAGGRARMPVGGGLNVYDVEHRVDVSGDARMDELAAAATLTFVARAPR